MTQPPSTKDFDKGLATRKQVMGEDFVYQIFRKRDCCAGNLLDYFGGG